MNRWNVYLNDEIKGPYTTEELSQLEGFTSNTRVSLDDYHERWGAAETFPELRSLFGSPEKTDTARCPECGASLKFKDGEIKTKCEYCGSSLAVSKKEEMLVATECPKCGSSIEYPDGSNTFKCNYCNSSLLITNRERIFHFHIKQCMDAQEAARLASEFARNENLRISNLAPRLYYVPFWRYTAISMDQNIGEKFFEFSKTRLKSTVESVVGTLHNAICDDYNDYKEIPSTIGTKIKKVNETDCKLIDYNILARNEAYGIDTLGIQAQVLKLESLHDEELKKQAIVLPPTISIEEIKDMVIKNSTIVYCEGGDIAHCGENSNMDYEKIYFQKKSLLGERLMLIYLPFWISDCYIGQEKAFIVINELMKQVDLYHEGFELEKAPAVSEIYQIPRFAPLCCPDCGKSMESGEFHALHVCMNCNRLWQAENDKFINVDFSIIAPNKKLSGKLIHLPMWQFEAVIASDSLKMSTREEFSRIVPRMRSFSLLKEEDRSKPINIYVQGWGDRNFPKVSGIPKNFLERQPALSFAENSTITDMVRCIYDEREAKEMAHLAFISVIPVDIAISTRWLKFINEMHIEFSKTRLLLLPFYELGPDLIDGVTGASVPKGELQEGIRKIK
ncbi:MAG: hypothetical protein ACMUJM_07700 [bacterium]